MELVEILLIVRSSRAMHRVCRVSAFVTLLASFVSFATVSGRAASPEKQSPAPIASFKLDDFRGKSVALDDYREHKAVVIVFLGTECPLATLYAPRLEQLSRRFAEQNVAFIGINANQQDSISELAHYAKTHEIRFPLLKDVGNVVADQLGAERTPEVFVLDGERRVRYRGRIDDQYMVGRQRKAPTREDLAWRKCWRAKMSISGHRSARLPDRTRSQGQGRRSSHLQPRRRAAVEPPLCRVSSRGRNRAVCADRLRRSGRLGGHDPGSRRCQPHAPLARQSRAWSFSNAALSDEEKRLLHDWVASAPPKAIQRPARAPDSPTAGGCRAWIKWSTCRTPSTMPPRHG
jgi:peroxiredoxin